MRTRSHNPFVTVKTAGLLLPIDLLARIADADRDLPGLTSESYHLLPGERLNEAASRAWNVCLAAWKSFRQAAKALPASDAGTTLTRDRWLLALFREFGYGRLQPQKAIEIEDKSYPISHGWGEHVPIHLVSFRYELERRTPNVQGAATRSPYSVMQELLNRSSKHRWGFLSNGLRLFVLRDNASLSRAANVEFDLEAMFDGEVYADFLLLFLICHQSRVEIPPEGKPEDCWLEKWSAQADKQGVAAREKLRVGVEEAIKALGAGFLTTSGNHELHERLRSGDLPTQDYYRQLLRLVYRLLLLLVAEEKRTEDGQNLLHPPGTSEAARQRYAKYYSIGRLRTLAAQRRGTSHVDLYESLKVLFEKLRSGYEPLGIPGLGSFLFSDHATVELDAARLSNEALLNAIRALCITEDTSGKGGTVRRPVDFANLGSDELGSVYESLLELHPRIDTDAGPFTLDTASGNERKTSGSYYTKTELISCVLSAALDPVVQEALNKPDPKQAEQALLSLKICDPACGSGHFLIAAADRMARHLASLRTGDDEPSALMIQHAKRDVIGHCIYGVDINPMAVELCKVSLWMEALEPGKPLSFLDSHIQTGNSLIGATPALLDRGIPPEAYKPLEGDDSEFCSELKADHNRERKDFQSGQRWFAFDAILALSDMPSLLAGINAAADDTLEQVAEKERKTRELYKSPVYEQLRLMADTWCAAFVWKKDRSTLGKLCPTERLFRSVSRDTHGLLPHLCDAIKELRKHYGFFHWHLAFPDVFQVPAKGETPENEHAGWNGGFDVMLGNPPWDTLSPDAKEFFAAYAPEVRFQDKAGQQRIIDDLLSDTGIADRWAENCRDLYALVHFIKQSGRFVMFAPGNLGKGDFNVYRMFVETALSHTRRGGSASQVVPEGLYNGANCMAIRKSLYESCRLNLIFGFENANEVWFTDIDTRMKFCIYAARINGQTEEFQAAFNIRSYERLSAATSGDSLRIPVRLVKEFSPDALAIMELGNQQDIDIAAKMYRWPAFGDESAGPPKRVYMREIDMGTDRELFDESPNGVPLFEGRMIDQFDYRAKGYRSGRGRAAVWSDLTFDGDEKSIQPQWYVPHAKVPEKCTSRLGRYRIGFCDVASPTNERTLIAALIPPSVLCGHSVPTIQFSPDDLAWCYPLWIAVANSYAVDFVVRTKVALHMTFSILDSVPFPRLERENPAAREIVVRSLRLSCTGSEMVDFWNMLASESWVAATTTPAEIPGELNEDARLQLRAEIDAIVARDLFGLTRNELEYILTTFPTQKRYQEETYGEFRSRRLILECFDSLPKPE